MPLRTIMISKVFLIVTFSSFWTLAIIVTQFFASPGGSTIIASIILTLVPLCGTAINGWFTRRRIQKIETLAAKQHQENIGKFSDVEKKVDGAASMLAESTKSATELAKAIETGKIKELEATIEELRKQIPKRSTDAK